MKGFRAWLELMRFSNAPTIITNVLVGWAVARQTAEEDIAWFSVVGITLAMLLFYAGGMMLNDVVDVEVDRRERTGRVIPSGRVSRRAAGWGSLVCLGGGLAVVSVYGGKALISGFLLLVCIMLYNLFHRRHALFSIVMGLCRGLVYLTATLALTDSSEWSILLGVAGGMTAYIAVLTVLARSEAGSRGRRRVIHRLLAGICILDGLILLGLGEMILAVAAMGCFALTWLGHRFISGT